MAQHPAIEFLQLSDPSPDAKFNIKHCTDLANKFFIKVKAVIKSPDLKTYPWPLTTRLTIELHDFDPVAAIEDGHGLTREQYFGVCTGTHELVVFPGGVRFVIYKSNTSEVA